MTTPCYYCEEDADVACRACIHHRDGPEIEQVIAWRAAPPPAADAVSALPGYACTIDSADFDVALVHLRMSGEYKVSAAAYRLVREDELAAALAARSKE
jgi:hypothetical protein